jgi:ribonuclease-3
MSDTALDFCQQAIGYRFKDPALLSAALTHASVASNRLASNERLEFFGDSVLGMVVCRYLYQQYPDLLEGELTKIKSSVVSRKTCADVSENLGLPQWLYLGNGIATRAKLPLSVAAAVFESLIAAMAIDAGVERTAEFILKCMMPFIEEAAASQHQNNYKSQLQQYAQRERGATPIYEMLDEKGPDHSKCFEIAVCIAGRRYGSAWGPSKKEAEQKAAWNALVELNLIKDETAVAP